MLILPLTRLNARGGLGGSDLSAGRSIQLVFMCVFSARDRSRSLAAPGWDKLFGLELCLRDLLPLSIVAAGEGGYKQFRKEDGVEICPEPERRRCAFPSIFADDI